MNISAAAAAGALYSFKSWYAGLLAPVRRVLVTADVPPGAITMAALDAMNATVREPGPLRTGEADA